MGLGVDWHNISAMRELADELKDEATVGRASTGTASISLRDGEMVRVNRIVLER